MRKASISHQGGIILEKGSAQVLASDYVERPRDTGHQRFSTDESPHRAVCSAGLNSGGHTQVSITGWVHDSTLLECFVYDIYYRQGVSVGTSEELIKYALLTALKNEDLRKERLKTKKTQAAKRITHLPSVDVAINILFVDVARGAQHA